MPAHKSSIINCSERSNEEYISPGQEFRSQLGMHQRWTEPPVPRRALFALCGNGGIYQPNLSIALPNPIMTRAIKPCYCHTLAAT